MKLMQKLNKAKKNKKGFTLVELIVVIVILGILAAILIPSFVGYMNKANDAQDKVEARSVYLAASTLAAEKQYVVTVDDTFKKAVASLADVDASKIISIEVNANGSIKVSYQNKASAPVVIDKVATAPTPSVGG